MKTVIIEMNEDKALALLKDSNSFIDDGAKAESLIVYGEFTLGQLKALVWMQEFVWGKEEQQ